MTNPLDHITINRPGAIFPTGPITTLTFCGREYYAVDARLEYDMSYPTMSRYGSGTERYELRIQLRPVPPPPPPPPKRTVARSLGLRKPRK